jgi:hypothetical protein
MWYAVVLVGILATAALVLFLRSENRRGRRLLDAALSAELSGDFETACFHYAAAAMAGFKTERCNRKALALWRESGPFEFRDVQEQLTQEYCEYDSCGEGYHTLVVEHIRRRAGAAT